MLSTGDILITTIGKYHIQMLKTAASTAEVFTIPYPVFQVTPSHHKFSVTKTIMIILMTIMKTHIHSKTDTKI